jgi:hypothetical protein
VKEWEKGDAERRDHMTLPFLMAISCGPGSRGKGSISAIHVQCLKIQKVAIYKSFLPKSG